MPRVPFSTKARPTGSITSERSARLYRVLKMLRRAPKTRDQLLNALAMDVRSFYRDLEKLRDLGVAFSLVNHRYRLDEPLDRALSRMPFPDPQLNLLEAITLAKGRTPAHRMLKRQIERITGRHSLQVK